MVITVKVSLTDGASKMFMLKKLLNKNFPVLQLRYVPPSLLTLYFL